MKSRILVEEKLKFHEFLQLKKISLSQILSRTDKDDTREDEIESSFPRQKESVTNEELHFGENWFHGKLAGGRDEAENLLRQYSFLGDGTFLVRESVTFVGDYCLSFWRKDKPNHCRCLILIIIPFIRSSDDSLFFRIKLKQDKGVTKYYLMENVLFDSLYSLIVHYRQNSLRSSVRISTFFFPGIPGIPNQSLSSSGIFDNAERARSSTQQT